MAWSPGGTPYMHVCAEAPPERDRPEPEEVVVVEAKAKYIPMVPIQNDTPTASRVCTANVFEHANVFHPQAKQDMRSRSPNTKAKHEEVHEIKMPSKKEIERDLSQGFVVVQKKGPPPLTAEQVQHSLLVSAPQLCAT